MLKNFKLIIEYDGSAYFGWQKQNDKNTIQDEIEKAVSKMTGHKITLHGSGRTDAGVHAYGQVANFACETRLDEKIFFKGLNSLLPKDIVIKDCQLVDNSFHARFSAKSKIYNYKILNQPVPSAINRYYSWFIPKELDYMAMRKAVCHIIGEHDFSAFEKTGSKRSSAVRNVNNAELLKDNNFLIFVIKANGFLRYMVRNLVGTLVLVGLHKINPDDIKSIILSKDRKISGQAAPPHGLFLMQVNYDEI